MPSGRPDGGIDYGNQQLDRFQLDFELIRNKVLNAGNFFSNATGAGKPSFNQNQFGVSGGGPIKKNKLFVFAGYEGYRQRQAVLFLNTVPSLEKRTGDFTNYRNAAGAQIPIYDTLTQCGTPGNGSCTVSGPQRQVFANNIIPASRINPVAKNYVNFPVLGGAQHCRTAVHPTVQLFAKRRHRRRQRSGEYPGRLQSQRQPAHPGPLHTLEVGELARRRVQQRAL